MSIINLITNVQAQTIHQVTSQAEIRTLIPVYLNYAFTLGGSVAAIYLILGGIKYITAGSDTDTAEQAKQTITYAIIGIVIIALSILIVSWLGRALDTTRQVNTL